MSDETNQHNEELLYEGGKVKIVHNKVLGGWYIVRGPHQTPIGGRHDSKEAAKEHLNRKNEEFEQQHDENLQDMVISALDKKVTDFNAAFQNVMNMKLADRVATLKSDLATKLFNPGGPAPEPVATEEIQPEDDAEVIDERQPTGRQRIQETLVDLRIGAVQLLSVGCAISLSGAEQAASFIEGRRTEP